MQKGVTFVIQGSLTDDTLKAIANCKKMGDVVVSCWHIDSELLIEMVKEKGVKLIVNTLDEQTEYNFQNIKFQIQSTLAGIEHCKTPFVVKVRSDEYFTNLKKFVSCVYLNPEKLTVSNFLFRGDALFHPSDHLIGGRPDAIADMLKSSQSMIEGYKKDQLVPVEDFNLPREYTFKYLTAETTFCISYLKNKGIDVVQDVKDMAIKDLFEYHRNIIKQHYSVVRASDLGSFLFRFKSNPVVDGPTAFTSEKEFLEYKKVKSIESLEEL